MSSQLTVIIPCKNEREHIAACITSAQQVADEVLVADSGSTDGTLEIARELGCRIVEREYRTSGDFKNWAIPQAEHDWVLILDADERIAPALAAEIRSVLTAPKHGGYWIYRLNHFLGHPIHNGPWKNDSCLRLFRRDLGRYVGPTDHAEVQLSRGTVGSLRERMTHYTFISYAQYLPKVVRYADVQSRLWHAAGKRSSLLQLLLRFPLRFLQGYILRRGFFDGAAGLQVCFLVAYQSYLKHAFLWQLGNARDWKTLEAEADKSHRLANSNSGRCLKGDSMSLRTIRRQLTPEWLRTEERRRWRDILFRRCGIQRCYTPPVMTRQPELSVRSCLPYVLAQEMLANPQLTFLQIGAFDGVTEDDLHELIVAHRLRGVLLEPQPAVFARLQETYHDQPQLTLIPAAIAEQEGFRTLHCIRGEASLAASFDRGHLHRHGIPDSEIIEQEVVCLTVASALSAAGLERVDLIQIDAEGYDWPIIRSLDFARLQPRILRFEYRNMRPIEQDACLAHLAAHGYRFIIEPRDIIAHQTQVAA